MLKHMLLKFHEMVIQKLSSMRLERDASPATQHMFRAARGATRPLVAFLVMRSAPADLAKNSSTATASCNSDPLSETAGPASSHSALFSLTLSTLPY